MTKFVNKKQNPLEIRIGDIVTINFKHNHSPAFEAKVTDIVDRADIGEDAMINYIRLDGKCDRPMPNVPAGCSVSHVVSVVHGPYQTGPKVIRNIFRDQITEEHARVQKTREGMVGWYTFGGIRVGISAYIVMAALAHATDELTRPYDSEKFEALWEKAGFPGKVASPNEEMYPSHRYLCVRWKTFKKWVLKNRHKLLVNRKELEQSGRDYQKAWEDSYYENEEREHEDVQYADDSRYDYDESFA